MAAGRCIDAILAALVALGRVDEADACARARGAAPDRFRGLLAVAAALAEQGALCPARLAALRRAGEEIVAQTEREAALIALARLCADAALPVEPTAVLAAFADENRRATARAALAVALAGGGQTADALALAEQGPAAWFPTQLDRPRGGPALPPGTRAEVFCAIAARRVAAADHPSARDALRRAEDALASVDADWQRAEAQLTLACGLAAAGDLPRARLVSDGIADADRRLRAQAALLEGLVRAGRVAEAEAYCAGALRTTDARNAVILGSADAADLARARESVAGLLRAELCAALVHALAEAGAHADALRLVARVPQDTRAWVATRCELAARLAGGAVAARADALLDEATAYLATLRDPPVEWVELCARALARAGRAAPGRRILDRIREPLARAGCATRTAQALAATGHAAAARMIAAAIPEQSLWDRALAAHAIAAAFAAQGAFDDAEATARGIPAGVSEPLDVLRAETLAQLAALAARGGAGARAEALLAELCAAGGSG